MRIAPERLLVATLLAGATPGMAPAQPPEKPSPEGIEFFESKIRPLLVARCYKCHSAEAGKAKGDLALDTRAATLKGGETGPAVVPGEIEKSLLIRAIRYTDPELQMPPSGKGIPKLTAAQVADFEAWVRSGAPDPRAEAAAPAAAGSADAALPPDWAFSPPKDHPLPAVRNEGWPQNPIDHFILARLEAKGLPPAPPADKRTLLRRATIDLTGLPPTPEEAAAFEADAAPDAFARVVDRLLASPRYGERWGRHWLDVVRYADARDTRGLGGDVDIGEAWRYRDWVVDAFNRDMPYDQFIVHQIAGDLLPPKEPGGVNVDGLVATGFLTLGEWGTGDADKEKMVTDIVDDQVDVVGRALMGLTVACARCHDHKFDPITAADYYALAGFFFSTHIIPEPGAKTAGSPMLRTPLVPAAEAEAFTRHTARVAELEKQIGTVTEEKVGGFARALLPKTAEYALAAWDYRVRPDAESGLSPEKFAGRRGLHPYALRRWIDFLGFGGGGDYRPFDATLRDVRGNAGVHGWKGEPECPSLLVNTTDREVPILTFVLPPRSAAVHPGPDGAVAVVWKSPVTGTVKIAGRVADADPKGGDGIAWAIDHRTAARTRTLAAGKFPNGGAQTIEDGKTAEGLGPFEVAVGDRIELIVYPTGDYYCDTTTVDLTLARVDGPATEPGTKSATWNLAQDLVGDPLQGNPHADGRGNAGVWSFHAMASGRRERSPSAAVRAAQEAWARVVDESAAHGNDRGVIERAVADLQKQVDGADSKNELAKELAGPGGPFRPADADAAIVLSEVTAELAKMREELEALKKSPPPAPPVALAAREGGVPKSAHEGFHDAKIHIRGSYARLGDTVPRGFPRVLAGDAQPAIPPGTSGRLELARWIASSAHPLTARVMVNRIWQHHFGEGLVRTPGNFGKLGERPTHPELLDALARQFVDSGWSVKAMHRAMMLSAAYQQSSRGTRECMQADPDNRLFGRMNRRRLEAEPLRDALLVAAGRLDPAAGGPSVRDPMTPRRMLYLMSIRSDRATFGTLFDAADSAAQVDRRAVSTVAPQALYLMNNAFALEQSQALAKRILAADAKNDAVRIRFAHLLLYARPPEPEEVAIGLDLLAKVRARSASDDAAWQAYAQILLCANEFIYVD